MWKCGTCGCGNDDKFNVCVNCGSSRVYKTNKNIVEHRKSETGSMIAHKNENDSDLSFPGFAGLRMLIVLSYIMIAISTLIIIFLLLIHDGVEDHFGLFITGLCGIALNITAIPVIKALITITEAAFIYKVKNSKDKINK